MDRVKTFDATGTAPNGRLYAGDLNSIQDAAAALMDLAQTLGVGTLEIGESGLQLLRYGAGEARVSGALRTDGILRALGGLYVGAFSTSQRDAIGTGLAPFGVVILNTDLNVLQWNAGTDGARVWRSIIDDASANKVKGAFQMKNPDTTTGGTGGANRQVFFIATDYDTDSWCVISAGVARFNPKVAGLYQFSGYVTPLNTITAGHRYGLSVFKNGVLDIAGDQIASGDGTNNWRMTVSGQMQMNGSTDYAELFYYGEETASANRVGSAVFQGHLVGKM